MPTDHPRLTRKLTSTARRKKSASTWRGRPAHRAAIEIHRRPPSGMTQGAALLPADRERFRQRAESRGSPAWKTACINSKNRMSGDDGATARRCRDRGGDSALTAALFTKTTRSGSELAEVGGHRASSYTRRSVVSSTGRSSHLRWVRASVKSTARASSSRTLMALILRSYAGYLPTMCGASLSIQTYSPISSLVFRSATLLITQGFE